MNRKGKLEPYLYVMLVLIMGIMLLVGILARMSPLDSAAGRAQELATTVAINLDSLSTVGEGSATLQTPGYKYDLLTWEYKGAWSVRVYPYDEKGKKADKFQESPLNSYGSLGSAQKTIINSDYFCLEKKPADKIAKVVDCKT